MRASPIARPPRAVLALTAVWTIALLLWSVLLPTFRSADESGHVSAAYYLVETGEWPGFQQMPQLEWVIDAAPPGQGGYRPLAAERTAGPGASFADLRERRSLPVDAEAEVNTIGQHPPLYHLLLAGAITVLPADLPAGTTVWLLRLLSVAIMAPLPLLLAHGARRLGGPPTAVVTAAALPLTVPQLGALGGAVNNDNLLILASVATTVLATHILTGDLRRRTAVLTGAALAVALLTKAFALTLVPMVTLVFLVAGWRQGRLRVALRRLALTGAVAALGGWWWIANLVRYGAVQPAGHAAPRPEGPLDPLAALPVYLAEAAQLVPMRFWATLSIRRGELPPPFPYWLTGLLFLLLLLAVAAVLTRRRSFDLRRPEALALVLPFVASAAILFHGTWGLYLETGLLRGLQGRYLYAGLAGVFLILALGLTAPLPRARRPLLPVLLTVGGLLFTLTGMRMVLGFHWAHRDSSLPDGLGALLVWQPVSAAFLAVLALTGLLCIGWTLAGFGALGDPTPAGRAPDTAEPAAPQGAQRQEPELSGASSSSSWWPPAR